MSQQSAAGFNGVSTPEPRTLFGHPLGLYTLFFTELWERFSFYGMRALLILYMVNYFLWSQEDASSLLGTYAALAYGVPVLGGLIADKYLGAKRAVIVGAVLLSIGHFMMAFEHMAIFYTALGFIIAGVGFLKPNISTQVGNLYKPDDPRRDGAFTIFYMGINLGALGGPLICDWLRIHYGWHYGFGAAGVGMLFGLIVYVIGQRKLIEFNQDVSEAETNEGANTIATVPPHIVRDRITVLLVIFAFVILFWMAFEQSANVMVVWADKHTNLRMFSSEPPPVTLDGITPTPEAGSDSWTDWVMGAGQTQSFNPLFIILLAPVFAFIWVWLDKRKLQPSTPTKMVFGIALVAVAFAVLEPAARQENRPSSAQLSELPKNLDLSEYGATRLTYDAQAKELRMKGVLSDLDRLKILAKTAPEDLTDAVESIMKASKERADKASFGEEWELSEKIDSAPPGFAVVGEEANKILKWDAATKTLTINGEIKERAKIELLATAALPQLKTAVDKIYLDSSQFRISIWWLILHFVVLTMGELCLSPVGLSLVTKLAPAKSVGLFMGGWFLATAIAEKLAHIFGGMWGTMTPSKYFMIFVIFCGVGALLLAILIRPLKRMMHGVH
ncbi:MAG: peptide MFS transporter [Phycisphaerae bacterium]